VLRCPAGVDELMCGFVAILGGSRATPDALHDRRARTERALAAIRHRGPDDQQFFDDAHVSLGFARLSIVDHESGRQPMTNETGRLWLVFNGEIYNHLELRRELVRLGHIFRTDHSDSEVLLHGWEQWGEGLMQRLNGMFAFVLWDQSSRTLIAARDRFGIKPLYWAQVGDTWIIASEIKAILASGLVPVLRNHQAMAEYMVRQNTWGEDTFFRGIQEFPKANVWRFPQGVTPSRHTYWRASHRRDATLSYSEAVEQHRYLLTRAVRSQMMADVRVMSYLSGGIDSSAITALAARERSDVTAYACLFDLTQVGDDRHVDEREFSRAAASYLGLSLNELELSPQALIGALDGTIRAIETPRMGMAYVNYLIAQRVARDGKVVLSGTGGDEYHGGYIGRYEYVERRDLPSPAQQPPARRIMRKLLRCLGMDGQSSAVPDWTPRYEVLLNQPVKWHDFDVAFNSDFLAAIDKDRLEMVLTERLQQTRPLGPTAGVLALDSETYLHGLLVIEDKLAMAHSLESRVPLLDNDLVDFTLSLPVEYLVRGNVGKRVFRDSVAPLLPRVIVEKPKMGFGPPDASWYRHQLRDFLEERLCSAELTRSAIFDPTFIRRKLDLHLSGQDNQVPLLWSALSVQSWHRQFEVSTA
jgi:asparagine synthase (glutamine-hydrolysing)